MNDRRRFLKNTALSLGAITMPGLLVNTACQEGTNKDEKNLGIALVGLGNYSENHLAPALLETEFCHLAGVVTGTPSKEKKWADKYGLAATHIYNYKNFDDLADNEDIDIVYVVLPNAMHAEFSIRAAQAGKHVICEKPMAISVAECQAIIDACDQANVKLQIGYRLLYEPNTIQVYDYAHNQKMGAIRSIESSNAFYASDNSTNWRFDDALSGGGPLMDMGVYNVHGVRNTMNAEPVAVTAQSYNVRERFKTIEETIYWQMEFASGLIANCMTSYSARTSNLIIHADQGKFGLEPAYGYGPIQSFAKGENISADHTNHQAVQMDAFARHILDDTDVIASGQQGLLDMKVIEAIYKAAETGTRVEV